MTPQDARGGRPRARPRRDQILAAARTVLARDGLAGLTALAVAREVPISEASVFYHFGSRDDLLVELGIALAIEEMDATRAVIADAPTGVDAMVEALRYRAVHYEGRVDALELVHLFALAKATEDKREAVIERVNGIFDLLEARLNEDAAAGRIAGADDVRARVRTLWLLGDGVLLMRFRVARGHLSLRPAMDVVVDDVATVVRSTFGPPPPKRRRKRS